MRIVWKESHFGKVVTDFDEASQTEIVKEIHFHKGDEDQVEEFNRSEEFVDLQFVGDGKKDVANGILFGVPRDAFEIVGKD